MNTELISHPEATRRRWPRRLLYTSLWITTAIALFYAIVNWHGNRAWHAARKALEAGGAELDLAALVPPPVPDDQNFAAQPRITNWFSLGTNQPAGEENGFERLAQELNVKPKTGQPRSPTDLVAWARTLDGQQDVNPTPADELTSEAQAAAARKVLGQLQPLMVDVDEITRRLDLPQARYPVIYTLENPWAILLPHLSKIRTVCRRLQLRSSAHLAAGDTDRALEDLLNGLKMGETLRGEPFLISQLVRIACVSVLTQTTWEGLESRRWSQDQLQKLGAAYGRIAMLPSFHHSMQVERAAGIHTVEALRRGRNLAMYMGPDEGANEYHASLLLARVLPSGWYQLEKVQYCRIMDEGIWNHVDWTNRVFDARAMVEADRRFQSRGSQLQVLWQHETVARLLLPALGSSARRFSKAQALADQAVIACALERHRLVHNRYPDTLNALVPAQLPSLPSDLVTGQPCLYKLQGDRYQLYAVGWNAIDDGGKVFPKDEDGDWVWGCWLP